MKDIYTTVHNKLYSICSDSIIAKKCNELYERSIRKQLKNDNFSIICPNCIGGTIYHRLGKKFLSPTINLYMSHHDFVKFVCNLREYLEMPLVFIETTKPFPVAILGGVVTLYFNHYKSQDEASQCWERRKARINYNNLYIIMYDVSDLSADEIQAVQKISCKGIAVLSENKKSENYVLLKRNKWDVDDRLCLGKDIFGFRTFEKQWNYVAFLNQ